MPLIIIGVFILIVVAIVFPLAKFMLANPISFALGLVALGILWIVMGKIIKLVFFGYSKISASLNASPAWIKFKSYVSNIDPLKSDKPSYIFSFVSIAIAFICAIYFHYYPLN